MVFGKGAWSIRLREFYSGHWPLAFVASDRNSQSMDFIKPKVVNSPGLSVGQHDGSANKLGLSLMECGEDCARCHFDA